MDQFSGLSSSCVAYIIDPCVRKQFHAQFQWRPLGEPESMFLPRGKEGPFSQVPVEVE